MARLIIDTILHKTLVRVSFGEPVKIFAITTYLPHPPYSDIVPALKN